MAGQSQSQNVDLFDAYFRRADLDRDGRISGPEAVAFLQGSNLPKQVLAQIWMHADQHKIGFLGRAEFYNALKLVTVAQSKRELTPDIVKAALYGPASAKIPAPQINFAAVPASPPNPVAGMPVPQSRAVLTTPIQSMGPRGPQVLTSASMGQQYFPSQQNHLGKPPRPMPPSTMFRPQQGMPGVGTTAASAHPSTNVSNDWLSGGAGGSSAGTATQVSTRGITPLTAQDGFGMSAVGMTTPAQPRPQTTSGVMQIAAPKPHDLTPFSQVEVKDSKTLPGSTNGVASDSVFGDVFSVASSQPKQESPAPGSSGTNLPVSSSTVPVSSGPQPAAKPSTYGSSQNAFVQQTMGGQPQQVLSTTQAKQQVPVQSSATFGSNSTGFPVGARNSASGQSQVPWPRMSPSDVQKYTKVFLEVDTDRDGKITGEQARNLFLSWRLPREILKEVWDLSDQDNDSMLSLREFCIALYLMERYREGRPLPRTLPTNIMFDDTLLPASGQPATAYGNANWRPTPGLQQAQVVRGAQAVTAAVARARQTTQVPVRLPDEDVQPTQQKSKVPVLEKHLTSQLSEEEQNSLNSKFQEATEANKKVEELEKEILDSRKKIEFFRTKMQELILYKSRCDNRLNEIAERTSADKREAESLGKKYEEKYKQSGDVASKLSIQEATFRDIQEKKMELYRSIVKMEQDGKADSIQANADQILSELEELVKSLNERCKSYGLRAKPTSLVELPFGWQPGIQEGAADWDENWDKFEDEGFKFVNELTLDVQNVIAPPKSTSSSVQSKASSIKDNVADVSSDNADQKSEPLPGGEEGNRNDTNSKDNVARSPPGSPSHASESPSEKFQNSPSRKSFNADGSPHAAETQSEHRGAESVLSGDKSFDEPSWGTFDTHYDTDSAWDFSYGSSKEMGQNKHSESTFFDDLGLPPIRTDSSHKDLYQRKSPFAFADSVPSTPLHNSGNSPQGDNSVHYRNSFVFDSVPSTPQADNLFQKKSTFVFDSVPSTPQADNLFQKKSTFAFDSVPSTPHADNLFQNKNTFAFDSVPSTPQADNLFQKKSTYAFDSVPSTPMYNYSNSPRRFSEGSEEHTFDSFSRFDSFNTHDSGSFPRESLTRFDSFRSTADSDYNQGFFQPQDSFPRFDSFRSTRESDASGGLFSTRDYARFDSMGSTRDSDDGHGFSFDDADPFGSGGPFKTSSSLESQTPRRDSDNWRAF
ncbi:uncharacterized protein LOC127804928 [Diospyros lotus]|uniref:uncharacterized protein LOC127804928 n=1 Tax=Diospyros lotus TaxID=55363 RepID=UPI00224FA52B|nr:uncharacterized protein LOC127804928 [Diospyros lotus]